MTLIDAGVGFYFHVRGVQRKPGGWRLPMVNIIMGPPLFAPLLFGTSAYLGLVASYLQREEGNADSGAGVRPWPGRPPPPRAGRELLSEEQDIREGRFQKQVAIVTGVSALLSGFEALYSHYKNRFRFAAQWSPIVLSPLLAASAFASIRKENWHAPRFRRCRWRRPQMQESGFSITHAGFSAGLGEESTFSITLCTGRRFLPRCCSARRVFWDCLPACFAGGRNEAAGE